MEYEQPLATENQGVPTLPEPTHGPILDTHLSPSHSNQQLHPYPASRKRGFWHDLGLLIAGLCCYAILIILAALAWGYLAFSQQGYISSEGLLPLAIFLGAIFLSSCFMTVLGRGGAISPVLLFSVLANVVSFLLAELSLPTLGGILIKLALSLLSATAGFSLTKLMIISGRR